MLKNSLKITLRSLLKNKLFSLLNFTGLAIGMSAFFLIVLYVNFEVSYDSFHSKATRIYRLVCDVKTPSEIISTNPTTSAPMAVHIKREFPEVEEVVRFFNTSLLVKKGSEIQEERSTYADPSIFSIFDFKLKAGNPLTALKEPFSIVISESLARKYFDNVNPIGQSLILGIEKHSSIITGVMEDIPLNSQIKTEIFVSMATFKRMRPEFDDQWGNFGVTTYLLMKPKNNFITLQKKFPAFIEKHIGESLKTDQANYTLLLEPLQDVYLKSKRGGPVTGNINNVYIFSLIGIFILLIAFINYVNITTARSTERAKEVGIKKIVGAGKIQLTRQFLIESVLICFIAYLLSVSLSFFFLPLFNQLSGKVVSTNIFDHPQHLILLLIISICIAILAGIYPALLLSSFKPVMVLKGRFSANRKGILLRKGLVIMQFTISIALITSTIIVYFQLNYMRSHELGFSKDQLLIVDTYEDKQKEALKEEIGKIPGVISSSLSSSIPGGGNPTAYSLIENNCGEMQPANLEVYFVDFDYISQFKMKVVAGRAFAKEFSTDSSAAMVLNETAIKLLGYSSPNEAIGKKFSQWGREGKIIGVLKDFHFRSLKEKIAPLCMTIDPEQYTILTISLYSYNLMGTIKSIESKFKQHVLEKPFNFTFADEFFNKQYKGEEQFGELFLNFSVLAILLSCLGLLSLTLHTTIQRTKEIGIRKVLGASVSSIVGLLSRDFLKLVAFSFCIAAPITLVSMHKWLEDYAYRINLNWWYFILGGIVAFIIASLTICIHAIKAAIANPVTSLRSE